MAKQSVAHELAQRIRELRAERREHLEALEQINETFTALGIDPEGEVAPRRGRPRKQPGTQTAMSTRKTKGAKKTTARRGRRGSYKQTAEQFILGLLENGRKLRTAEINQKWTDAKRGGTANNTLSKLTKAGTVKKENIPGARGSQYSAA